MRRKRKPTPAELIRRAIVDVEAHSSPPLPGVTVVAGRGTVAIILSTADALAFGAMIVGVAPRLGYQIRVAAQALAGVPRD